MTSLTADAAPPRRRPLLRRKSAIPGFGITLGLSLTMLCCLVLIPMAGVAGKAFDQPFSKFVAVAFSARAIASYKLTFGASAIAALVNGVFGPIVAWALVRYKFPFKRLVDGIVDLPFALPTAVAGIALTNLYADTGWIGAPLAKLGIKVAYTPLGIIVALTFIGLPFVVRTIEPLLREASADVEEAAASLGAGRWQTLWRVIAPSLTPAWVTGVALAFARGVGEYGSVIFIAGNMPFKSEIAPLLIVIQLEQFNYPGACAIAMVMLAFSFLILLFINAVQTWARRRSS